MGATRREFLTGVAGATAAAAAVSAGARLFAQPATTAAARPNIVFCIADDWSAAHAGAYGDAAVKTPAFDRVAREGALFARSYCAAPTCTASRAGILTGQAPHRLENSANLWSTLPAKFEVYPEVLEAAGYFVGLTGKGWGPGAQGDRKRNAAGPPFRSFEQFLGAAPKGRPFCYWFGSSDPHRPYERALGEASGIKAADVTVPPIFPDTPETRGDLIDYYAEVQRFDAAVGAILKQLDERGLADTTLVIVTSDNGMPFPRAKANLYRAGTHMPLAMRWPGRVKAGQTFDGFVSHVDLAPTMLAAAGARPLATCDGHDLVSVLARGGPGPREAAFVERERHAAVRAGNLGYPSRAVRTRDALYVRNFAPGRWPAGDPDVGGVMGKYGDIDAGPTKAQLLAQRDAGGADARRFELACGKRPAEELYVLADDPHEMTNVADDPKHADLKRQMRRRLDEWMAATADPRSAKEATDEFDKYPYTGPMGRGG